MIVDDISAKAKEIKFDRVLLTILAIIPLIVGWLVGISARCLQWILAAFVKGYEIGRGVD